MKILALDLGKFNSVSCLYDTKTAVLTAGQLCSAELAEVSDLRELS